jgi:prevent-host-death family protein
MTEVVNMHQAKSTLSRLVARALAGEEIVIARNGKPLVRLVPVPKERKQRAAGRGKGKIWISPAFEFTEGRSRNYSRRLCENSPRHKRSLVVAGRITAAPTTST